MAVSGAALESAMADWSELHGYVIDRLSSSQADLTGSEVVTTATVVQGLLARSGLERRSLERWRIEHGDDCVDKLLRNRIELFREDLEMGLKVEHVVMLVTQFLRSAANQ